MVIKMPKLSKAEMVAALLNEWDPEGRCANGAGYRAYNYEAETIAEAIRKNSRPEKVEKAILDVFDCDCKPEEVRAMAHYILEAIKR